MRFPWSKKTTPPPPPPPTPAPASLSGARARITEDSPNWAMAGAFRFLYQPDADDRWRDLSLDSQTLDRMAPHQLLKLLCDLSPDISRALWDLLRFANPGWTCEALGADGITVDKASQSILDAFLGRDTPGTLKDLYGSPDVILNRLYTCAFLRGAFFAEIVLDRAGRVALDLATPDPNPRWFFFKSRNDPDRGIVWDPYQWQQGEARILNSPTIKYVPVDPLPGSPYGRPIAAPALFTCVFAMSLLHDLRRVVQQQGYPRIDIKILMENLIAAMPAEESTDPSRKKAWLDAVVDQVTTLYASLQPDDAFVHTDMVEVGRPVGTVDSSSLGGIDGLLGALDRYMVRALKSVPFMMALLQGSTETQAIREWESYVAGVRSLQHLAESLLEHLLGIVLRAAGKQATVRFRFAELRASEEMRDRQTEGLKIANASLKYAAGWIDQDAAAKEGADVDKADAPEPRTVAAPAAPAGANPELGGSARWREDFDAFIRSVRAPVKVKGEPLPRVDDVEITPDEIAAAVARWDAEMPERFRGLLDAKVVGNGKK